MDSLQALLMGLLQGFTEYLPVSSSGHLTIAGALLGVDGEENLMFTISVHVATVLSTLLVLRKEIASLFLGLCAPSSADGSVDGTSRSSSLHYLLAIVVSMIPVGIVGVFFKDKVEEIFSSGLLIVGVCLLVTAALLFFSQVAHAKKKEEISLFNAFVIGLAQACAVLPGLSRSGCTIATGLLLGNDRKKLAQFSFLMVIPPILGEALLDAIKMSKVGMTEVMNGLSWEALSVGFIAAFAAGALACKWMIALVSRGKLAWFALYCLVVGLLCLCFH